MAPTRVYSSERPSAGKHSWEREETKRRETYLLSIERHNIARLRVFTYLILFASFFYLLTLCVIAVKSLLVLSFSLSIFASLSILYLWLLVTTRLRCSRLLTNTLRLSSWIDKWEKKEKKQLTPLEPLVALYLPTKTAKRTLKFSLSHTYSPHSSSLIKESLNSIAIFRYSLNLNVLQTWLTLVGQLICMA